MKSGLRAPTPEELGIINTNFAKKELKAEDIYVFDLMAANSKTVTSVFSKLGPDMIEAFHANVQGRQTSPEAPIIGFLFGHNKEMIPSGTLFQSKLEIEQPAGEGAQKVLTFKPSVYMSKNLNVAGINTDEYIRAYEAGHTEDVSVGFIAGSHICDICNNDVRSWSCQHIPGRVYNLSQDPEKPIMKQATYTVHQGMHKKLNLAEVSGVYKGALPGAKVENQFSADQKDAVSPISMSRNIKDFKEGDILRFNCAGDGVIELLSRPEGSDLAATVKEQQAKIVLISGENNSLREKLDTLGKANSAIVVKCKGLETSMAVVTANLSLSEADKVDLTVKLAAAEEGKKKAEADKLALQATVDSVMKDLRDRSEKLSIKINGMAHKPELFQKEIGTLGIEELRAKITAQEEQLAKIIPSGRQSSESKTVHGNGQPQGAYVNQELYKIG
jgi:hypothetical protein